MHRLNSTPLRLAMRLLSDSGRRLWVTIYHRVRMQRDPLQRSEPDAADFAAEMTWLREYFDILPLGEALDRLYDGRLDRPTVAVTFDDGYADNCEVALPILRDLGLRATFFVTTGYLEGGMMWSDRVIEAVRRWPHRAVDLRDLDLGSYVLDADATVTVTAIQQALKYLPPERRDACSRELQRRAGMDAMRLMMDEAQLRTLHRAGMEIGGHTHSHPILCALDDADARDEIARNKRAIEGVIAGPVELFAYPNGKPHTDYDRRHLSMLRDCGYRYAVTTSPGTACAATSRYQIPRFTPWDRVRWKYALRALANYRVAPIEVPEPLQ